MAAAVATLDVLKRDDGPARMAKTGTMLREGLDALSRRHGVPIRQTGPVQMPLVLFEDDPENQKGKAFCSAALRAGAYFHPRHNMFLSVAHTEADIGRALEAAEVGFSAAKRLA
jgi:glutamate-1-semialdehyde 2,1-aminomutase